jgi:PAS domain S-box-containing protein
MDHGAAKRFLTNVSENQPLDSKISPDHCARVQPEYVTVINSRRRFVEVSASFCTLLGYSQDELIGKLFDDFTVPHTTNIAILWRLFVWTERMVGVWVFAHKSGTKLFVRYEAFARSDGLYEAHMDLLGAGA